MGIKDWNAGIIRPVAVAPTGPYQDSVASGIWRIDEAAYWSKQGLWPTAGNLFQRGIFGGGTDGFLQADNIQYINITTLGNAAIFGSLSLNRGRNGGCASSTRGVFIGGSFG